MEQNIKSGIVLGLVGLVMVTGTTFASPAEVNWGPDGWRLLGGTIALTLATLYTLRLLVGGRAALQFMASTLVVAWLAEAIGLQGNWLFGGAYAYHANVQPVLPGGVPLFIPLAWFVLCGVPVVLIRSLKTTNVDGTRHWGRILFKSAYSALGVVACDLALDPIAVSLGLWVWERPGPYFGVPLMNCVGWWVVAWVVFLVGYGGLKIDRHREPALAVRYELVWGGAHLMMLILLGYAASNRAGCGQPVLLAMMAMLPLSVRWLSELYGTLQARRRGVVR